MSRQLILIRHAKSDWDDPALPDHDRPLNDRGRRAAVAMGNWMIRTGIRPDRALLSTAKRVVETWEGIALDVASITRTERLYLAAPEAILSEVAATEDASVLVIAHNPGMASLAQYLVATTPDRAEFHRFPTGATLVLDIPGDDWASLGPACGRVEHFVVPRDLID